MSATRTSGQMDGQRKEGKWSRQASTALHMVQVKRWTETVLSIIIHVHVYVCQVCQEKVV